MGRLGKVRYSHLDMIDYLIAHPATSQNDLAARYGYSPSWVSNIMASDAWKSMFAKRRGEMIDPVITQTIEERILAMSNLAHERIMEALERPACPANVALKAFELGAKSMGLGNQPPAPPPVVDLDKLASRLLELNPKGNVYEAEQVVPEAGFGPADAEGK